MKFKLKKHTVNVVWISPIITPFMFSPEWFRRYELLREEDIDNSNTELNPDEISTDYGWIEVACSPTKAVFQLRKAGLESALGDLTSSIFAMFEHAETQAIGINTLYIYDFQDKEQWNAIGDALVPKALWEATNKSKILQDNVDYHYGMRKLILSVEDSQTDIERLYKEAINITYAPLHKSESINHGLQIQYNHDLVLSDSKNGLDFTKELIEIIPQQISEAIKHDIESHESIFNRILS
ncbi:MULTISPECIES: hypothetical protein [Serratia]|uniref:hypothetical protein n=1 Tax=Serratia TaxID=613 RepID=UPI0018D9450F|nr:MULTISPECIES: hypothetical protein [Serratia]MBH2719216.1 hypothetical protein [Serratia ureilytica]MDP8753777.1 hypothetical protein [Serratia marcescens]MDP8758438.1 hypothetical protein [Serratia marcescens]MDP8768179.1 hypothetical protein [Serratia marcescens]MDP8878283.1 hypothetical protein [Serratia marcescens]